MYSLHSRTATKAKKIKKSKQTNKAKQKKERNMELIILNTFKWMWTSLKFFTFYFTSHCIKSVNNRSFAGTSFTAFGLKFQSECGKIRTRKTLNTNTFYAAFTKVIIYPKLDFLFCHTTEKMKFSIKDFLSKCDQICGKLRIWSHLLKNSLMKNFVSLQYQSSLDPHKVLLLEQKTGLTFFCAKLKRFRLP